MKRRTNRQQHLLSIAVISILAIMLWGIVAGADEPSNVDVKIKRVALFKNGLGYFSSSSSLPTGATDIRIGQLPVPSYGTFWVGYPDDLKVRGLYTGLEDETSTVPARNIVELLQNNPGRKVTVTTNIPEMSPIKGTIIEVIKSERSNETLSPYSMSIQRPAYDQRYQPFQPASMIIIKTGTGNVALNTGQIVRADFEDEDIVTSVSSVSQQPSIRLELDKAAKGQTIGISYLAHGITWSPSYLIDITDSKLAKLSAKAVVINEAADLKDVHLDLVTGFPNIRFSDINSPVAKREDLAAFLRALSGGRNEAYGRGSSITSQLTMNAAVGGFFDESSPMSVPMPSYSTAQEGTVAEDLFLYPVDDFNLKCGETACLPLFTAEVPYKHIYVWEIPDMLDEYDRYNRSTSGNDQPEAEEVWHCCRLTNNMKMPWTTAAVEFVNDGQFAGQDICYYTAPGAETTIRLNRAMNVLAEQTELELDRQRNARHYRSCNHDLVKVKGEMRLRNRMDKAVTVEITKNLTGEVQETIPEAKDTRTAKGLKTVNSRHELVWEIELQPGQEQNISYTYEVYICN